jgi:hypothetical protein
MLLDQLDGKVDLVVDALVHIRIYVPMLQSTLFSFVDKEIVVQIYQK